MLTNIQGGVYSSCMKRPTQRPPTWRSVEEHGEPPAVPADNCRGITNWSPHPSSFPTAWVSEPHGVSRRGQAPQTTGQHDPNTRAEYRSSLVVLIVDIGTAMTPVGMGRADWKHLEPTLTSTVPCSLPPLESGEQQPAPPSLRASYLVLRIPPPLRALPRPTSRPSGSSWASPPAR
jgi:hypothetical protein